MTSLKICWNDLNLPPINLWNVPMTQIKYTSLCYNCNREKTYKTEVIYNKCKDKLCKSCANSIQAGGVGYAENCKCGNPKHPSSSTYCKECANTISNKYHYDIYRYSKYGVTKEWYDIEIQKGCAICGTYLNESSPIKRERGHIDHCHSTGKVRGVLCDLCNKGLGQFKDSIDNLENAIKYLKEKN
jgi:hypothetical protein